MTDDNDAEALDRIVVLAVDTSAAVEADNGFMLWNFLKAPSAEAELPLEHRTTRSVEELHAAVGFHQNGRLHCDFTDFRRQHWAHHRVDAVVAFISCLETEPRTDSIVEINLNTDDGEPVVQDLDAFKLDSLGLETGSRDGVVAQILFLRPKELRMRLFVVETTEIAEVGQGPRRWPLRTEVNQELAMVRVVPA